MKIYVTPVFAKRAEKAGLSDANLREAVARAERHLIDGPLGGYLIKQRVARRGQGRAGGFRTILYYKQGENAAFIHMFAKNSQANLTLREQEAYRDYAGQLAKHTDQQWSRLVTERGWRRIDDEQFQQDIPE